MLQLEAQHRAWVDWIRHGGIEDVRGPGGSAVRILFWLVSPAGASDTHVKSLASIASLVRDDHFMELLTHQTIPQRVLDLIGERA